MTETISTKVARASYTSSLWVVRARWYYAFLAFILGVISVTPGQQTGTFALLGIMFGVALLGNLILSVYLVRSDPVVLGEINLWRINIGQVIFDLLYIFFMLVATGAGLASFVHVFFFVPIIVSMILFGFRGAMSVAGLSGLFLIVSGLAENGMLRALLTHPTALPQMLRSGDVLLGLVQSGVVVLIYLLIGYFSGTVARTLASREADLRREFLEEEAMVNRLKDLTRDFELSSKMLVRRDIELTMANERMQALDAMKTEIISVAAHQLRTPLSGMKWMMKMLLVGDIGEISMEQREIIQRGYESNERLIRLVNDMLAVDRLESGRVKYVFVPVQIQSLIEKVVADLLQRAAEKQVHIVTKLAPDVPRLYLDPERITDLLNNLIDNAIKYSKNDGVINVVLAKVEESARIIVSDEGIGIPDRDQAHVFSRFFRASNAMQHFTEGSGLGLSIAQSVALRHGGKIWFESKEGVGTIFTVQLPITQRNAELGQ
ncbi:MAG TPA: HAMP domain-containing sensor histidine kinase [Candidatus Paceibacterota bacterium]|nr:HAMP domain-containing sensor histidine kinase [Candidatus Paceibacterota bacterium]